MSTQPEPEVAPALCGGRYRLEEVLGAGGMAKVYKAFDRRLEVYRAIKILSPAYASHPEIRKRFLAEARTTARLSHPCIVTAHDIGADGDRLFIVMELLEGGSIWDRMRTTGALSPQRSLEVMQALLPALEHAHGMGVIHRDIKPGNILVSKDGSYKLADFGIARVAETDGSTRTGSLLGTPAYMAPEQWNGSKELDGRADLFALAATLYSLVTLQTPQDLHIPESQEEQLRALPEPIRTVIQRGARYRPADRYGSAREMLDAVNIAYRRLLGQEAITVPATMDTPRNRPTPSMPNSGVDMGRPSQQGPTLAPISRVPKFNLFPEDSTGAPTTGSGPVLELDPARASDESRASAPTAPSSRGGGSGPSAGVMSSPASLAGTTKAPRLPNPPTPIIQVPELHLDRGSLSGGDSHSGPHSLASREGVRAAYAVPALEEDPVERRRKLMLVGGAVAAALVFIAIVATLLGRGDGGDPSGPQANATPSNSVAAGTEDPSASAGPSSSTAPSTPTTGPGPSTQGGTQPATPDLASPHGPTGRLVVECRPDCTIFVDQQAAGTGRVELTTAVGRRTVSVGDPGSRVNATVTVEDGKTATFCWDTNARKRCKL